MGLVVQKFNGNTISDAAGLSAAVGRVKEAVERGDSVVVVAAALEGATNPYSTEALAALAHEFAGDRPEPREMDLLLSCGEVLSAVLLAERLNAEGVRATALTGGQAGIITDANFGKGRIRRIDVRRVRERLRESKVVVVAGFQGVTERGETTTLGPRGADLTAAALGSALNADAIEIYRDLAGVTNVDPRLVPDARTLEELDFLELEEMTRQGAHLVLPEAVELASSRGIPVRIRDVAGGEGQTLVRLRRASVESAPGEEDGVAVISLGAPGGRRPGPEQGQEGGSPRDGMRVITTITHREGLAQIVLLPLGTGGVAGPGSPPPDVRVFRALGDAGINVDLVNISHRAVAFTVAENDLARAREVIAGEGVEAEVTPGCAKITLIGAGMASAPGTLASVASCLFEAGVAVLQTADSDITISCLIKAKDLGRAIKALHECFLA